MENEPSHLEKTVIDNIRKIRQEKGISQLRLSIFCGTSASYIGLMETYKNIPKLSTIERIAEALDVPVLELFKGQYDKKGNKEGADVSEKERQEDARKQKIREQLKSELLSRMGKNLDDVLQMI
ncbi:MAG: helix-turn-helix transcriptional regulator [Treponema sp.]|nr:helix-turn-helix transcriptional regulator [Treponema sp.]